MRSVFNKLTVVVTVLMITLPSYGQTLQETLESMLQENAKGYLSPVVTAFGTGVNSGTFHTAKSHKMLGFDVTLNVSVVAVPDASQEYEFYISDQPISFPISFNDATGQTQTVTVKLSPDELYDENRTSSTFFGKKESNIIAVDTDAATNSVISQIASTTGLSESDIDTYAGDDISTAIGENLPDIKTPEGFGFPALPMIMPQVSVGLPMDIEVTLRGFPKANLGDAGELSFFGFGGKIGLTQFIPIPMFPVQLSAGYYLTSLKLGDVLESNHSVMTLQASKSLPFLTIYGGFGLESSSMDVNYTYIGENNMDLPVSFSLDGDNTFRTIVGLRLKLAVLSINADYNVGEYSTANIGVGFTLR